MPTSTMALETMTLRHQVAIFAGTRTLVAQHGAALVNMLWMPPGGVVVEIDPKAARSKFRDYFRALAACCGHRYGVVAQDSPHAPVDAARIVSALRMPAAAGDEPR